MNNTEFRQMCRCVEKNGIFQIPLEPGQQTSTEVIKHGPGDYAVYNCWPCHRDCVATDYSLERMKFLFVD